jgi:hypothetical protein
MSNMSNPWNEPPKLPPLTPEQGTRLFFGATLLIFGLIVGGAVLFQLKQVVFGPAEPALVTRLAPSSADDLAIKINHTSQANQSSRIDLPPKTLSVIGYFFALLALWIASMIAYATISGGARLLLAGRELPRTAPDPVTR